jgi:SAF domain
MRTGHALLERGRGDAATPDDARSSSTAGVVGRRSRRLTGRAAVGGLLVALAGLGAFVIAMPDSGPAHRYVIAAHAIEPGTRIGEGDLELVAADLPEALSGAAFTAPDQLNDRVALAPIAAGELVQSGAVGARALAPFEVAVSVEGDRSLDGQLRPGERVAVLATYGSGPDAATFTVVGEALVERITRPSGLAVGTTDVVTVGLATETEAQAVVHAARAAELTFVRTEAAVAGSAYVAPISPAAGGDLLTDGETAFTEGS